MSTSLLLGFNKLSPTHQKMFKSIETIVGKKTSKKIWALYIETGLINKDATLWGDKNPDGTSKGPIPHSYIVALSAYVLAKKLGLSNISISLLIAGMVHDAFKRQEIENPERLTQTQQSSESKIRELFGNDVAVLAGMSGHTSMLNVLANIEDLATQIFFWTDNAVIGTTLHKASEKCDYLDASAKNGRYPYNDEGIAIWGVPYFTFQRYLACVIEASIGKRLGVTPTTLLYKEVEKMLVEYK